MEKDLAQKIETYELNMVEKLEGVREIIKDYKNNVIPQSKDPGTKAFFQQQLKCLKIKRETYKEDL